MKNKKLQCRVSTLLIAILASAILAKSVMVLLHVRSKIKLLQFAQAYYNGKSQDAEFIYELCHAACEEWYTANKNKTDASHNGYYDRIRNEHSPLMADLDARIVEMHEHEQNHKKEMIGYKMLAGRFRLYQCMPWIDIEFDPLNEQAHQDRLRKLDVQLNDR